MAIIYELIILINSTLALINGLLANWVILAPYGSPTLAGKGIELITNINNIINIVFVHDILPFLNEILNAIALF